MKHLNRIRLFFVTLHREAALDSLRNVLAVIGLATVLADFGAMRVWMLFPCACLLFAVWRIDYWRHFRGEDANDSLVRELKEAQ
jgi:hypothetical protein